MGGAKLGWWAGCLAAAVACWGPAVRAGDAAAPVRLGVIVAIDGLSWERLHAARPWLRDGLARLLDEGHVEAGCRYRHLNTETSPGHAALSTGAPPRVTGIVANRWFEHGPDGQARVVTSVEQPGPESVPGSPPMFYREVERDGRVYVFAQARELARWEKTHESGRGLARLRLGPKGETVVFDSDDALVLFELHHGQTLGAVPARGVIQGPGKLRVPTLGDRLVAAFPASKVVSVSAKDRSAMFLAGRDPRHVVYWYDKPSGRFVTSQAYDTYGDLGADAQAIVARFNRERAGALLPARFGLLWKRLPDAALSGTPQPRPTPVPDLQGYQIPTNGLLFDHPLTTVPGGYFEALYESPFTDELVADLALTFLADNRLRLGQGATPDLLTLSFSAHDIVSHAYGVESEESLDALRRVDIQLGRVLSALDAALPAGGFVLALSADHGFSPIPEANRREDPADTGGRLLSGERGYPTFAARLSRALAQELCLDPHQPLVVTAETSWNIAYAGPFPLRSVEGACGSAGRAVESADFDRVLPGVVERMFDEEVQEVLLVSQREHWPADDPAVEFARNDLDLERSGDAFLIPRRHVLMHYDPARGSGHGSHHEYDIHVPLVLFGRGFRAGTSNADSTPYDLAPTLAAALGVTLPDAVGRSLLPAPAGSR